MVANAREQWTVLVNTKLIELATRSLFAIKRLLGTLEELHPTSTAVPSLSWTS